MVLYSIRRYFHHQSHPQLSIISALTQSLSGAISNCPLLFPTTTPDTFRHGVGEGGLIFWYHIFSPFHTIHGGLKVRILQWVAISSSSGPHFVRTLHYDLCPWVALHGLAHGVSKLHRPLRYDKAVICEGEHHYFTIYFLLFSF